MKSMLHIIRVCLAVSLLMNSVLVFAQDKITVTGHVKDEAGAPIVGAAVMADGTSTGVLTDLDGKYTITFTPKGNPTLVFSSLSPQKRILASFKNEWSKIAL